MAGLTRCTGNGQCFGMTNRLAGEDSAAGVGAVRVEGYRFLSGGKGNDESGGDGGELHLDLNDGIG